MSHFAVTTEKLAIAVARSATSVLLLTSVHHAYGAYLYDTPWRLRVVSFSVLAASGIIGSALALRRWSGRTLGRIAFWALTVLTLVIPIGLIGLFEGAYNHVIKNAVYFAGAPSSLLNMLFPPSIYELPNSLFFEMTGVMQFVAGAVTARQLYRLLIDSRRTLSTRASQERERRSYASTL